MSAPLPPDVLARLQARLEPPRERFEFPWGKVLFFLIVLGVLGWFGRSWWLYRLPQERMLTDYRGRALHVKIIGRSDLLLKCDWLDDPSGRTVYIPVTSLNREDRAFAAHLEANLSAELPLTCLVPDADGAESIVTFLDRNDKWVKLAKAGGKVESFAPLASFPPDLQAVVNLLPPNLYFAYPMDYVLTGPPAPGAQIKFLGRTDDFVQFAFASDNVVRFEPLANFSPTDGAIIRSFPLAMAVDFPVVHSMTTLDGRHLPESIKAVSSNLVALTMPTDGSTRYFPISDLSVPDQKFVHILPVKMNFSLPVECTMADADGNLMRVRLEARAAKYVKLTQQSTGATEFRLLTDFSLEDNKVLQMLPTNYSLSYPFDYTLSVQGGPGIKGQVVGRTEDTIKYRLVNGTVGTVAMAKLTPHDQEFLSILPVNFSKVDLGGPAPKPPPESIVITGLRNQIATLEKKNLSLASSIANPATGLLDRDTMQAELERNQAQIDADKKKIETELARAASAAK